MHEEALRQGEMAVEKNPDDLRLRSNVALIKKGISEGKGAPA
jgi:hypothetical protein